MANLPAGFVPDDPSELPAGFEPDVEEGGPESFLDPKKFKPSPQHRKLNNTGSMANIRETLARERPVNSLSNDIENAVAVPNSMVNTATFGAYGGLMGIAKNAKEAFTGEDDTTSVAARTLSGMDRYRRDAPTVSSLTDIPAYLTKAPMALAEGVAKAIPAGTTAASRLGAAGLTSGLTSGIMGGTEAAFRGEDLADTMRSVGENVIAGTAVGGGLGIGAGLLGSAARKVVGSEGGKARQFLEGQGVEVSPGTPGRGPKIDTMVNKGTTDAAIGEQAEASATKGLGMLNDEQKAVKGVLGRRIGAVEEGPAAAELNDVSDVVRSMREATEELDTSPMARGALHDLLRSIEAKQGQGFNADTDNYLLSHADVNKLRRALDRYAKTGTSTDASLSPLKAAAAQVREMAQAGPFGEVNADYAKETKNYQESRGLLGINKRPKTPEESKASTNTVKNLITRRGQNTVTAGGQTGQLEKFAEKHPDIGEELMRPEVLRKRADIGFRVFPQHGGLIDRTQHPMAAHAAHALLGGITGVLPALAYTNRNAINARLLYGPAQGALQLEPMFQGSIPLLQAAALNSQEP